MPHVGQRLLVHLLVLDDGPDRLRVAQQRMIVAHRHRHSRWRPRCARRRASAYASTASRAGPRGIAAGDRGGLLVRIDAAREDRLEVLVDARVPETLLDQRVDGERRAGGPRRTRSDCAARSARGSRPAGSSRSNSARGAATRAAKAIERLAAIEHGRHRRRARSHPPEMQFFESRPCALRSTGIPTISSSRCPVQELLETAQHRSEARCRRAQPGDCQARRVRGDARRRRRPRRDREFRRWGLERFSD